jgi:hypothetical protein
MNTGTTSIYPLATCAECATPAGATMPNGAADRRGWARCSRAAGAACVDEAPIHAAIRRGDVPNGTSYRATLAMTEIGPLDMTVTHRSSDIAIRLHGESHASYIWLTSKRALLESRLTRALGTTVRVEVTRGQPS